MAKDQSNTGEYTWRDVLADVLRSPGERARIAREISCHPYNFTRWLRNQTTPPASRLFALRDALPEDRQEEFSTLLEQEQNVQQYSGNAREKELSQVPGFVYDRVLEVWNQTPEVRRFWEVSSVILQHAISQLDSREVGVAISIIRCMPPTKNVVRSLRKDMNMSTPPLGEGVDYQPLLLGSESLAGHVVTTTLPCVIQNIEDPQGLVPLRRRPREKSAAAYPIIRGQQVAGCLMAICTRPEHFSAKHIAILMTYSKLCTLAFEAEDFFSSRQIELREMPQDEVQYALFPKFRQWRSDAMREAGRKGEYLSPKAAGNRAWVRMENALLDRQKAEETEQGGDLSGAHMQITPL